MIFGDLGAERTIYALLAIVVSYLLFSFCLWIWYIACRDKSKYFYARPKWQRYFFYNAYPAMRLFILLITITGRVDYVEDGTNSDLSRVVVFQNYQKRTRL